MKFINFAPSNLALIKYMGKTDDAANVPANSSLSYTIDRFRTFVEAEVSTLDDDSWEPLNEHSMQLSKEEQTRFLVHCKYVKNMCKFDGNFIIRSGNNFPKNVGLASSASSFAALTKSIAQAISLIKKLPLMDDYGLATISQHGSGSSCRSFFSPWALWSIKSVDSIDIPYNNLQHKVIIVSREYKKISSSVAHKLVWTSPLFEKRLLIIEDRLQVLIEVLKEKQWMEAFKIVWQEFTDMHLLFETAKTPFSYLTNASIKLLDTLKEYFSKHRDGPLVTMDAGPNIHLLFRSDQGDLMKEICDYYSENYEII